MGSNETDSAAERHPGAENPSSAPAEAHDDTNARLIRGRRWLALAGVVAGILAFGIGEAIYELIPPENGKINTMGFTTIAPTAETKTVAEVRNGALTFGMLGICLAGSLGIAGGLARRSIKATLIAGGLGSVLGLAAGVGISLALIPLFLEIQPSHLDYEVILSATMHGAIWGPIGAAAGLAFAVGLGEPRMLGRALAAGLVGALLGTIAFDLAGAGLFPLASTGQPISTTWPSRLLARMVVTLATAAVVILSLSRVSAERKTVQ